MTEGEAIKEIERWTPALLAMGSKCTLETQSAQDMAIKALEDVQKYRENEKELLSDYRQACKEAEANARMYNDYLEAGTVEECIEAVEKQKAKHPDYEGDGYADGQLVYDTWICPCCGKHYEVDYDDYDYCPNCGQHIDWRVNDAN